MGRKNLGPFFIRRSTMATMYVCFVRAYFLCSWRAPFSYTIVTYHKIKPNNTRLCRSAILRSGPLLYIKTTVASPCYGTLLAKLMIPYHNAQISGRTKSLWSGLRLLYHHGWSSGLAISRCTGYSFVNPIRADPTLIYDAQFLTVGSIYFPCSKTGRLE